MGELDKKEGVSAPKTSEKSADADSVIRSCQSSRTASELTTHFLGGYFAALVPTVFRKKAGWEERVETAKADIVEKLRKLALQMDGQNMSDIGSRIRAISELVAQPITNDVVDAVSAKHEELREYIRSKEKVS